MAKLLLCLLLCSLWLVYGRMGARFCLVSDRTFGICELKCCGLFRVCQPSCNGVYCTSDSHCDGGCCVKSWLGSSRNCQPCVNSTPQTTTVASSYSTPRTNASKYCTTGAICTLKCCGILKYCKSSCVGELCLSDYDCDGNCCIQSSFSSHLSYCRACPEPPTKIDLIHSSPTTGDPSLETKYCVVGGKMCNMKHKCCGVLCKSSCIGEYCTSNSDCGGHCCTESFSSSVSFCEVCPNPTVLTRQAVVTRRPTIITCLDYRCPSHCCVGHLQVCSEWCRLRSFTTTRPRRDTGLSVYPFLSLIIIPVVILLIGYYMHRNKKRKRNTLRLTTRQVVYVAQDDGRSRAVLI